MGQKHKRNNKKIAGIVLMIISVVGFIFIIGMIFAGGNQDTEWGPGYFLYFFAPLAVLFLFIAIVGGFMFFSAVMDEKRHLECGVLGSIRCPECNAPTELRTVKKGKNTGNKFWVCIKYPECKGRIQVRKRDL